MRFILVDRIIGIEKGREGSFLKNVSQSEDYFTDHFPESPIMPGVLILEGFDQAAQFLVGCSHDFTCYPQLKEVLRVAFRHFVIPGDQLQIRLQVIQEEGEEMVVKAAAEVNNRIVAEATLRFTVIQGDRDAETKAHCQGLKTLYDLISSDHAGRAWENLADHL
ncbi:beta-hydroxyacyl-ACP dehydratase [bacterium]|nr:MAG: beta-hydroxyacyl-ACP dehydratase [bacterium]